MRTAVITASILFMGSESMQPLQAPRSRAQSPTDVLHGAAGSTLQHLHCRAKRSKFFVATDLFFTCSAQGPAAEDLVTGIKILNTQVTNTLRIVLYLGI